MKGWYALVAFIIAWLIAQVSKLVIRMARHDRTQSKMTFGQMVAYFMQSGGMPSGHTASLTAAIIYLGCLYGFDSGLFALGLSVWFLTVYDATHVRYAVGEQGKVLNEMLQREKRSELSVVEGHTLPQVLVGAVIGIVVGVGAFWLLK